MIYRDNSPLRSGQTHRQLVQELLKETTKPDISAAESKYGVRVTPFLGTSILWICTPSETRPSGASNRGSTQPAVSIVATTRTQRSLVPLVCNCALLSHGGACANRWKTSCNHLLYTTCVSSRVFQPACCTVPSKWLGNSLRLRTTWRYSSLSRNGNVPLGSWAPCWAERLTLARLKAPSPR